MHSDQTLHSKTIITFHPAESAEDRERKLRIAEQSFADLLLAVRGGLLTAETLTIEFHGAKNEGVPK
jgi:hypothetical protein